MVTRNGTPWAVVVVAAFGVFVPGPASPAVEQGCPVGQHEDSQTPGFQCVPGWCPPGTLLDSASGTCVTVPGVPPPALPQS